MPHVYSQSSKSRVIDVIAADVTMAQAQFVIARNAQHWAATKPGRKAAGLDGMEVGFYFSDGKLAATMWIDAYPTPAGEPKLTAATGEIPGLKV